MDRSEIKIKQINVLEQRKAIYNDETIRKAIIPFLEDNPEAEEDEYFDVDDAYTYAQENFPDDLTNLMMKTRELFYQYSLTTSILKTNSEKVELEKQLFAKSLINFRNMEIDPVNISWVMFNKVRT